MVVTSPFQVSVIYQPGVPTEPVQFLVPEGEPGLQIAWPEVMQETGTTIEYIFTRDPELSLPFSFSGMNFGPIPDFAPFETVTIVINISPDELRLTIANNRDVVGQFILSCVLAILDPTQNNLRVFSHDPQITLEGPPGPIE